MLRGLIISVTLGISFAAQAVTIPKELSSSDRAQVVRLLALPTATKLLSNPFPLGGYSGFEVGVSVEQVNIRDLSSLGCAPGSLGCPNSGEGPEDLRFTRLTFGKGIYNNVDLMLNFSLLDVNSDISTFGGAVRYSFYEAQFLPVNLSVLINATHLNVNNDFSSLTFGGDLVAGIYVDQFSLYMGIGQLNAQGTFVGGTNADGTVPVGDSDLNAKTNTATSRVRQTHTMGGITFHFANLFTAFELDRVPEPIYSARLGLRF